MPFAEQAAPPLPEMQFPTEFDWVAPSGRALLTCFMADHYSAGWWMDAATTLEQAEAEVHALFTDLAALATTKNVLLPVGTDYSPPNKWLTAIYRDWNSRYVWPKFLPAIPRQFFAAVREERARTGRGFPPQSRDMNPIYTGKDVSFIDTKQAQRIAENTLLGAEKFATIAGLLGARFPSEAVDKAWRQLLFGAHHDGITGSESDQVYLDLLAGWREAIELGQSTLDAALEHIGARVDTTGDGLALTIFNQQSWSRSDVVRTTIEIPEEWPASFELVDEAGESIPFVLENAARREDGRLVAATVAFMARDVPGIGYRTYRLRASTSAIDDAEWANVEGLTIENDSFEITVAPERGGAIVSLIEKSSGKQLIKADGAANELIAYREYPNHPLFAEGPWHLTPSGTSNSSIDCPVIVSVEASPVGHRIRIEGPFESCFRRQEIVLWDGLDRVDLKTRLDEYTGHDRLFRVRFPASVEGGASVSEVGNAVVGRPFGRPNVDTASVPFTLDHPAYNWFALGSTARVVLADRAGGDGRSPAGPRSSRAIGVAEVVGLDLASHDDAVRALVVALVRAGVTSTLSLAEGHLYGILHIDSNLPDVRVAIGRPSESAFVAAVLTASEPGYSQELDRQLEATGRARVWIPAPRTAGQEDRDIPDVRGARALPVLIVAGVDEAATIAAIEALVADLDDATIEVAQPAELDGTTGHLEDYTVGILNRGMPGFSVEAGGNMYLSLMRSCSGWPSGVWIDPPRRSAPDGSNFQFQHWSHTFEYALVAKPGDWRAAELVRAGHDYCSPLIGRVFEPHDGELPTAASFLEVEPATAVVTALKPAGNPMANLASPEVDLDAGLVVRLYESSGRATEASIRSRWLLEDAQATDLLEEASRPIGASNGAVTVHLEPNEIATVRGRPRVEMPSNGRASLVPAIDVVQPVFADYWLHNKGAAPLGYQPLAVQIRPSLIAGSGPFQLPISVASERTGEPIAGTVGIVVPARGQGQTPEPN
jgi:alpha-mannosidase